MKSFVVVLLMLGGVLGCSVRTDFIPANGKRLSVYDKFEVVTDVEQVQVGEIRNNSGDVVGTAYANRKVMRPVRVVYGQQDAEKVDDESFYRIVRDQEAIAKYDEYHANGRRGSIVASILLGGGLGLTGGSIALLTTSAVAGAPEPCHNCAEGFNNPINNLGRLAIGGIVVGILSTIAGGVVIGPMAKQAKNPDARLYTVAQTANRMKDAAERYNDSLPGQEPPPPEPPPPAPIKPTPIKPGPNKKPFQPRVHR